MKRSLEVAAPLLASTAIALLTGCHQQPEPQRCVDEQNRVVAASFCANLPQTGNQQNGYRPGFPGYIPYHYYYGGYGQNLGDRVGGGGFAPMAGHSYGIAPSTRGGFGSSFHSSGAHGSGAAE